MNASIEWIRKSFYLFETYPVHRAPTQSQTQTHMYTHLKYQLIHIITKMNTNATTMI